jgi:hypothetical protein
MEMIRQSKNVSLFFSVVIQGFQLNILSSSSGLDLLTLYIMSASQHPSYEPWRWRLCSSDMLVSAYKSTLYHNPGERWHFHHVKTSNRQSIIDCDIIDSNLWNNFICRTFPACWEACGRKHVLSCPSVNPSWALLSKLR